ncbi:DUF6319 domain-containing protein [Saccharomonospora xinjiangensis]|uniref:DUF6319 family protein n=1 Tax=Saccharomonospora xinjiangensis TaxID=75294 RepID=UPI00106F386E|nr:DUF6319 family protein [Saccharomonospora xinjiangensis]QBQ62332.1 hypothetical protein EYD13_19975 [Saccharomonospora xinjiangensis]
MTVDAASANQELEETPVSHESEQGDAPEQREQQEQPERAQPESGKPQRAKAKSTARKTRTVILTLTVTGTADGEWQAELKHGSKWVAKGLDIPASAVSRAAKELHEELSAPIDEVINEAREQQQAKVAQLEAELQQAKQALAELES